MRDILLGVVINALADQVSDEHRTELRRAALDLIARAADRARTT
jgi:hypothetical protein